MSIYLSRCRALSGVKGMHRAGFMHSGHALMGYVRMHRRRADHLAKHAAHARLPTRPPTYARAAIHFRPAPSPPAQRSQRDRPARLCISRAADHVSHHSCWITPRISAAAPALISGARPGRSSGFDWMRASRNWITHADDSGSLDMTRRVWALADVIQMCSTRETLTLAVCAHAPSWSTSVGTSLACSDRSPSSRRAISRSAWSTYFASSLRTLGTSI